MSEENNGNSSPKQPTCIECGEIWKWPWYQCKKCTTPEYQATVCKGCRVKHMRKHTSKEIAAPALTPMGCVVCGATPTGTCSAQNPPCPAPLCDRCREHHERKHLDSRSDAEKSFGDSRILTIMEEIDRDKDRR